jgi:hypothetical protein
LVPAACRFEPLGIAPDRAAVLADLTISAFEGAAVLSRAARSTEPFNTTNRGAHQRRRPRRRLPACRSLKPGPPGSYGQSQLGPRVKYWDAADRNIS